jgi:hypothetical protein
VDVSDDVREKVEMYPSVPRPMTVEVSWELLMNAGDTVVMIDR